MIEFTQKQLTSFLATLSFGNVDEITHGAVQLAVPEYRPNPVLDWKAGTVQPEKQFVRHVSGFTSAGSLVNWTLIARIQRAVRMSVVNDIVKLPTNGVFFAVEAKHAPECRVSSGGIALAIHRIETIRSRIEEK
jgi:hypothetical protein